MQRWSWIAVCFCPPFFCMFSFAQTTSMNSGWTIRCCWGFMIYVSWSVTQTSAGWQSGVKWLAVQDKLSRYDLELLNLSQIPSETAVNQSLNLSLYLSFCLSGSWQLNFPKAKKKKNFRDQLLQWCFAANSRLSWCLLLWVWAGKSLDIVLPTPAERGYKFSPEERAGRWGEGKLAIHCSHASPRLEH